jgi:hypothetical protein
MAASVGRGLPSTHSSPVAEAEARLVAMTVCGTIAIESDPEAHAIVARVPSKAANEQMRAQTVR